jgi:hypothetical protein
MRSPERNGGSRPWASSKDLYLTLGTGFREDLESVIGLLLGYEREDIEYFVRARPRVRPPSR